MGMKSTFDILSAIIIHQLILSAVPWVTAVPILVEIDEGQREIAVTPTPKFTQPLTYLGTADGKSFFVEANLTKNWMDAKSHCQSANLELVSIESKNQVELLKQTLIPYGNSTRFWTSAREARRASIMNWDTTGSQPDTSYLPRWFWFVVPYQYCGAFVLWEDDYRVDMDLLPCWVEHYVLCQKADVQATIDYYAKIQGKGT